MFIFLFLNLAFASAKTQNWHVANLEITLRQFQEGWVNPSCLNNPKCQALIAVNNKVKPDSSLIGGANPGAQACVHAHKGEVIVAKHGEVSQSLCRFPDGSYASVNGLVQ